MRLRNGKAKVTFEVKPEIKKRLHLACVENGISMSSLIEDLVEGWLDDSDKDWADEIHHWIVKHGKEREEVFESIMNASYVAADELGLSEVELQEEFDRCIDRYRKWLACDIL